MKIRNTILLALIALLSGVGVLAAPQSVQACSCLMAAPGEAGVRESADRVQLVFTGTVQEVSLRTELIRFDVSKIYKGELGKQVTIKGARDSAACGWVPTVGLEYVVYAHQDEQGQYMQRPCVTRITRRHFQKARSAYLVKAWHLRRVLRLKRAGGLDSSCSSRMSWRSFVARPLLA